MCEQLCQRYTGRGGCGCTYAFDYQKCNAALARPHKALCVPPTGNIRDLPRVIDVQDDNLPGNCPVHGGQTPPSSQQSHLG